MNKVILIGRLTRDPELRFTPGTGNAVATFALAVDRNYVGQSGQREADFLNIVCWGKLAELVANNLSKGRLVGISGRIQTRNYQAQDGSKKYITEIVADEVKFLDRAKEGGTSFNKGNSSMDEGSTASDSGFFPIDEEDDIPF